MKNKSIFALRYTNNILLKAGVSAYSGLFDLEPKAIWFCGFPRFNYKTCDNQFFRRFLIKSKKHFGLWFIKFNLLKADVSACSGLSN